METREDITIRFVSNGIIVEATHPDYSRGASRRTEMVFNSVVEFEKWFEHHTGEGDENDNWPRTENGREDWMQVHVQGSFEPEKKRKHVTSKKLHFAIDPALKAVPIGHNPNLVIYDEHSDHAADAMSLAIRPIPQKEETEAVDALRAAEDVVKRFTGVK